MEGLGHHRPAPQRCCCCVSVCSVVQSCLTLWDPLDCSRQAPLSTGFSRQEYWSGLLCPPLGDLLDPGNRTQVSCASCIAGGLFTAEPPGSLWGGVHDSWPPEEPERRPDDTELSPSWVSSSVNHMGTPRVFSNTTVQKHQFFGAQLSL